MLNHRQQSMTSTTDNEARKHAMHLKMKEWEPDARQDETAYYPTILWQCYKYVLT